VAGFDSSAVCPGLRLLEVACNRFDPWPRYVECREQAYVPLAEWKGPGITEASRLQGCHLSCGRTDQYRLGEIPCGLCGDATGGNRVTGLA
jgi:hypothetical protein